MSNPLGWLFFRNSCGGLIGSVPTVSIPGVTRSWASILGGEGVGVWVGGTGVGGIGGRKSDVPVHTRRNQTTGTIIATPARALTFLWEALGTLRSEEHTSELQSRLHLVCRLLLEKKKKDRKQ